MRVVTEETELSAGALELIMVAGDTNNNKYYRMIPLNDGTFRSEYGRVGASMQTKIYPMGKWDSLYREKTGKGYRDVTALKSARSDVEAEFLPITDERVRAFVARLERASSGRTGENYLVKSSAVTKEQMDKADELLRTLLDISEKGRAARDFNERLEELFSVVPRRMTKVSEMLLNSRPGESLSDPATARIAGEIIVREQDLLDGMRAAVRDFSVRRDASNSGKTVLEALGLKMYPIDSKDAIFAEIRRMMGSEGRLLQEAYGFEHSNNRKSFESFRASFEESRKKTELLWHGSRTENWWSIIGSGKLKLNPGNAVRTGSMFGHGLYFANKCGKSVGYTSLRGSYWAGGSSPEGYMALFDVLVGRKKTTKTHGSWCYGLNERSLAADGYDSLHALAGHDLRNDEIVVYDERRVDARFIVKIGE